VAARSRHERFRFPDKAALARCAGELGVKIPFSDDVGILFKPVEVAGRCLRNRFAVQPMEGRDAEADGAPGSLTVRRYRRYAAGGSALIWFEATAVTAEGRASPRQLWITPQNVSVFRKLVNETRAAARASWGAGHELLLILQLTHSGRYARPEGSPRPIIAQHSPILDSRLGLEPEYPLITDAELDRLQEAFAGAAELAAVAGFDGVDIKACHGYLVSELLAAFTRTGSRYGGSFENRVFFLLDAVARIRARVPGLIVSSRFSVHDGLPWPYGFGARADAVGGEDFRPDLVVEDFSEPTELARRMRALGCSLLNVSVGNPYFNPHYGRPFDTPTVSRAVNEITWPPMAAKADPTEAAVVPEHPLVGVARLLRASAAIQKAVPDVPVVGTGYSWLRHLFPHVVSQGGAALVGLGRMALAYPECVKALAEKGGVDPAKTCTACSGCSQIMRNGGHVGCRVRDAEIYSKEYREGRARAAARTSHGAKDVQR
jgi:2,4-dienoyl-CoA reductase (NADPH2)